MAVLEYAAVAVALACAALYAYFRHALGFWKRRKVFSVPISIPFGNYAISVMGKRSMPERCADMYFEYKDQRYIGTYFLTTPMLQLHDPAIIQQVFIKESADFNGRGMHCDPVNDPLSGNLFGLSGQPWRNMRVKLSPTFTTGKIKYMFSTIEKCTHHLRDHIVSSMDSHGGRYEEDVRELVARFGTDIISSVAFGIESNSMKNPDSEFRRMGARIFESSLENNTRLLLAFFGAHIMKVFGIHSNPRDVDNFFSKLVDEIVTHREKNDVERADMVNLLIKLKNEGFVPPDSGENKDKLANDELSSDIDDANRQKLTIGEISAQMFVFFAAGFETTSTTTSFTLYELAKNPDIQGKVVEEIDAVLKKHNGKVTYETIMDLPYTEMAVRETMRLYPPVPFLTREAMVKRQLPLTDVVLEKGTRLTIPVWGLHKDPQYWPDPERYDPLRFTEEAKKTRPSGVYLPFGDGPRICIGMRLGLVQVKMALVTILSRCSVSLAPGMPREPKISPRCVVPQAIDGCRLILTGRRPGR